MQEQTPTPKIKPLTVLISDVHYSMPTLAFAEASLCHAILTANELGVPLTITGDLHDSKANLRAECIDSMMSLIKMADKKPYILVGNHDKINENSHSVNNALMFLSPYAHIIDSARTVPVLNATLIPYQSNPVTLGAILDTIKPGSMILMHQGCLSSNSGHYFQDKTALPKESYAPFRVISGHYHTRQDIVCGPVGADNVGIFSYVGNPYTLNYGEANDPEKGFQILYTDGSLEFRSTHIRKHITANIKCNGLDLALGQLIGQKATFEDLVWLKVSGTREELLRVSKEKIEQTLGITIDRFELDIISPEYKEDSIKKNLSQTELLDSIIDADASISDEQRSRLKIAWRQFA